jgi:NADH-quinone oxidoreductase subunit F/NADP-reducing hydrogenase subunit HndC
MLMRSVDELKALKEKVLKEMSGRVDNNMPTITVHMGTCGIANGAKDVLTAVVDEIKNKSLTNVTVAQTGCPGICYEEPVVTVAIPGQMPFFYGKVSPEKAKKIVTEHFVNNKSVQDWLLNSDGNSTKEISAINYFKPQKKVALTSCGAINPEIIEEYIAVDGYFALAKALTEMTPLQVIDTMSKSGLRGRGGGGFPTGRKWEFAYNSKGDQKYVVCNELHMP